jgi:hypothetical protein
MPKSKQRKGRKAYQGGGIVQSAAGGSGRKNLPNQGRSEINAEDARQARYAQEIAAGSAVTNAMPGQQIRLDGGGGNNTGGIKIPGKNPIADPPISIPTPVDPEEPKDTRQELLNDIATGKAHTSGATRATAAQIPVGAGITSSEDIQQIQAPEDIGPIKAEADTGIPVTTGTVTDAAGPTALDAAKMQAATIDNAAVMDAASGAVSKMVDAGQGTFNPALDGETISPEEIAEGKAMTIEGALSSGAFAEAAKGEAASVDTGGLPRLEDIDLMSPTVQAEVAELPEEALVSTQMNSLLEGMEEGKTPAWALPALEAVEANLAQRGMTASSVGRNALFSAIVSAALPIAQGNAQALKERANLNLSNRQQASMLEAQLSQQGAVTQFQATAELQALNAKLAQEMGVANLNAKQQAAIYNATTQAGMDMANFTNKQQVELANSQWMQTASLQNLNNRQQAVLQEATLLAQQDLANADMITRASIENAKNFLAMDMTNLNNEQQANVLNQQAETQRLLSNQSAQNAARQFNAASENQVATFMANLGNQVNLQNAAQANAMEQFNATQANAAAAQESNNLVQLAQFNAQLENQIEQFNAEKDFQVSQWNAANAQAIEQSNINWRRQANTADTAAQNAINQQNALNAFNLEKGALDTIWQQLRDEASFEQQNWANYQNQIAQLYATAIGHEKYTSNRIGEVTQIIQQLSASFGGED